MANYTSTERNAFRKAMDEVDSAIAHIDHALSVLHEHDIAHHTRKRLSAVTVLLSEDAEGLEARA